MKRFSYYRLFFTILLLAMLIFTPTSSARGLAPQVSLATLGTPYTQDFDTLSNAVGSTTNFLAIDGWYLTETGGGARDNELYGVDSGASLTGDTYSYGAIGATDRALGGLLSGTLIPTYGASFTNNTGDTIDTLAISYIGEEWRLGFAGRTDRLDFQYSLDATALFNGSWTDVNALDFTTPDATAPTGAKNGNTAGYRAAVSSNIPGLSIPNGATFWVRWNDFDAANADDGLAVDDFSLTPYSCQHITVSNNADSGAGSLRQAIADACSGGTITFDNDYTILLASQLTIAKNLTIDGAGHSVTVSGNDAVRVFKVTNNAHSTLSNLTITSGKDTSAECQANSCGGGLEVDAGAVVIFANSAVLNSTAYRGGGIYSNGNLTVTNSAFLNNTAGHRGGGLYNYSAGTLTVSNSTLSGNTAATEGGGIINYGILTLTNSTLSGNSAPATKGAGILNGLTATIANTIIANSTSGNNCGGAFTDGGGNLAWGDATCAGALNANPLLGTLGNYGGSTQTFPLLPDSAAIDAGDSATCAAAPVNDLDQRGVARPAACDIGAFESRGFTLSKTGGDNQFALVNTAFTDLLALSVTANAPIEPVNGGVVAFTGPASGASTNPMTNTATIAGGAVARSVTANGIGGGPYNVVAGAAGAAANVNFALTNLDPTPTPTATHTVTVTVTPTGTETSTPTVTHTVTATVTATKTETSTPTVTHTVTSTVTPTETETSTPTVTHTATATVTITQTATPTQTVTHTSTVTATPTKSPTGTLTVTSTPTATQRVNQPPVISEGESVNVTMSENGSPISFTLTLHATDVDHDRLGWCMISPAKFGSAGVYSSTGEAFYTPAPNYNGADSFVLEVSDGQGAFDTITVNVAIQPQPYNGILIWNQSYDIAYDTWLGATSPQAFNGGDNLAPFGGLPFAPGLFASGYRRATSGDFTFKPNFAFTQVKWITYRGPDQGRAAVLVDGVVKATVDLYRAAGQWQYPVTISGLTNARHTVIVRAMNARNARSTGKWVVVDGFQVGAIRYDDNLIRTTRVAMTYGSWAGLLDTGSRFGAYRVSGKANASMGLSFDGSIFNWVTARGPAYGKAAIYVDGVLLKTVDLYAAGQQWQYKITISGLAYGHHTVLIKVLGTKNPHSTGMGIVSDGFEIE